MMKLLSCACVLAAGLICVPNPTLAAERPNVLFVIVDDLRPELGCYGNEEIETPHFDTFSQDSTTFLQAYCPAAACAPSRAIAMTGLRPDTTRVWDLEDKFRENMPEVVTLPRHFHEQGYHTVSLGKIFHNHMPDRQSFDEPDLRPAKYMTPQMVDRDPESFYHDDAIKEELSQERDRRLARNPNAYAGGWAYGRATESFDAPEDEARRLKHGYYASVSFVDACFGRLIEGLAHLELDGNTIVVVWGDHGWKLGEHGSWCKQTNYDIDVRVPLLVRTPGTSARGAKCERLVELVDLFPTLCDVAGVEIPDDLEGTSFAPLLRNPKQSWKSAAFSQFHRSPGVTPDGGRYMGYSMITPEYHYVEWRDWDAAQGVAGDVMAVELYRRKADPGENTNIARFTENGELVTALAEQLDRGWRAARPADQ